MTFEIVCDLAENGGWIAKIENLPDISAKGASQAEARSKIKVLALRILADRIEANQSPVNEVRFVVV
jgi:predicted RNase H-like HicB family nuclease